MNSEGYDARNTTRFLQVVFTSVKLLYRRGCHFLQNDAIKRSLRLVSFSAAFYLVVSSMDRKHLLPQKSGSHFVDLARWYSIRFLM